MIECSGFSMSDLEKKVTSMQHDESKLESRRTLLKLGAVSLPMVITAKASASGVLHSTTCTVMPPSFYVIYSDGSGQGWYLELSDQDAIDRIRKDEMSDDDKDVNDAIDKVKEGIDFTTSVPEGFYYSDDITPFNAQEYGDGSATYGQQAYWEVVQNTLSMDLNLPGVSCVVSFTSFGHGDS